MKARRNFYIYNGNVQIGHGVYYPAGGNCQLYLKSHGYAAWQLASIAEVLLIDGVDRFEWHNKVDRINASQDWREKIKSHMRKPHLF